MPETSAILSIKPLDFAWQGNDPFLVMANHVDHYPAGNGALAPVSGTEGRQRGNDFSRKDGWSMYYGGPVPGFPVHPHRGFETVTLVLKGYVDHTDTVGGRARYGMGDVQWLTAGGGIQHAEMFPLLHEDRENPLHLIQIWLNLPAERKMSPPYFSMFWAESIPRLQFEGGVELQLIAGELQGQQALTPPPDSWASDPRSALAIWLVDLPPGASWQLPAASRADLSRVLHLTLGEALEVEGQTLQGRHSLDLRSDVPVNLVNRGRDTAQVLMLQAAPIGEPVAMRGPFVMNTDAEIEQAYADFHRTRFGRWPHPTVAPTHGNAPQRFAVYPDGREDSPPVQA